MGFRSGAPGLEARTRLAMVPAPAGGRFASGCPRAHRRGEPRRLAHTLAPFRNRTRGPRPSARAEKALARVIESDKATSGAVRDLVGLVASTVEAPQMLAYERLVESSRVIRDLTAKLRQDHGVAPSNLVAICGLERGLAKDFWRRGKYSESRTLIKDSIELLEGLKSGADDPDVVLEYARSLGDLGWAAREQEQYDEALVWLSAPRRSWNAWPVNRKTWK